MFEVNDHIVYGNHGVCKVVKIGPLSLPMVKSNKKYYTLKPVRKQETAVYAPVENPKNVIRPVITKEQARELLDEIPNIEAAWIGNEKERETQYRAALHSCDCKKLIRMIITLYQRKQDRIKDGKKVTVIDERYLKQAEEQFFDEISFVLEMDRDELYNVVLNKIES